MISVFEHPWLGALFGDDDASALWSADVQLEHYKSFEAALAHALETTGRVPAEHGRVASERILTADISVHSLGDGTATDGLPVPALVRQLKTAAGEFHSAVHTGATSQDVIDTALALTLKNLSDLLISKLSKLDTMLVELERTHGNNPYWVGLVCKRLCPSLLLIGSWHGDSRSRHISSG